MIIFSLYMMKVFKLKISSVTRRQKKDTRWRTESRNDPKECLQVKDQNP